MLRTVCILVELGFGSATQPGSREDGRDVEQGQAGMRGLSDMPCESRDAKPSVAPGGRADEARSIHPIIMYAPNMS